MEKITLLKAEMHIASLKTNDGSRNWKKSNAVSVRQFDVRKDKFIKEKVIF